MRMRWKLICVLVAGVLGTGAAPARAEDVAGAARAFSQAQEVMLAGDSARAADLYELADELSPSAPALRNAARARLAANHLAMAATHAAALLRRYPADQDSRSVAEALLSKLAPRLTELAVTCSEPCAVTLDGKAASQGSRERHAFFAQPGGRTVGVVFDGDRRASRQLTARAGQGEALQFTAPPRPAPAPAAPLAAPPTGDPGAAATRTRGERAPRSGRRGISRGWAIGGAVVTVGLGAGAAVFGMQTLGTRDRIAEATEAGEAARAMQLYDEGRAQQLRTNVLLGATAAAGVATIVLTVLADWSGDSGPPRDIAVIPQAGGAAVVYGARF